MPKLAEPRTTRAAEGLPRRPFSVDEIQRMLELGVLSPDEKFELVGGELVPMSSQLSPHAQMKARIARWFGARLGEDWDVGADISVRLSPDTMFDPDVLVWRPVRGRQFIPITAAALAVEVSDTSLSFDVTIKAPAYARAGLDQLWIVDLNGRETRVFTQPGAAGYGQERRVGFEAALTHPLAGAEALVIAALESR